MDIRSLQNFLAIVREGSISAAAESLHMTQPPLSRQLKMLEEELHTSLFYRDKNRLVLTPKGEQLARHAYAIVEQVQIAKRDLLSPDDEVVGVVSLGVAETDALRDMLKTIKTVQAKQPKIQFRFFSGNAPEIMPKLAAGNLDFGLVFAPTDITRYNCLKLFHKDSWGVLMRKDSPLASRASICPQDLWPLPLIVSEQSVQQKDLASWMHKDLSSLNIVATYNLLFNASLMVREKIGYALCLYNLFDFSDNSPLCFRPLLPTIPLDLELLWSRETPLSAPAAYFLDAFTAGAFSHESQFPKSEQ